MLLSKEERKFATGLPMREGFSFRSAFVALIRYVYTVAGIEPSRNELRGSYAWHSGRFSPIAMLVCLTLGQWHPSPGYGSSAFTQSYSGCYSSLEHLHQSPKAFQFWFPASLANAPGPPIFASQSSLLNCKSLLLPPV